MSKEGDKAGVLLGLGKKLVAGTTGAAAGAALGGPSGAAAGAVIGKDQRIVIVGQKITEQIRQTSSFLRIKGLKTTCVEFSPPQGACSRPRLALQRLDGCKRGERSPDQAYRSPPQH